jgi:hypothetical protein
MPELEKLEQFNQELIKSGDEPAVALKRGEEIERALTPEEYPLDHGAPKVRTNASAAAAPAEGPDASAQSETDDFLSRLAGDGEPEAAPGPAAGGGFDDLFDSDILSGMPPAGEAAEEPAESDAETPGMADFGFDDLFGESADAAGAADAPDGPEPADSVPAGGESADFGDFGDFGGMEEPSPPGGPDDLSGLGDLADLGEPSEAEDLAEDALPAEAAVPDQDFGADFGADFADLGAEWARRPPPSRPTPKRSRPACPTSAWAPFPTSPPT